MFYFNTLIAALFAFFGAAFAATATPITFTYTSAVVDWSLMETWEADFMARSLSPFNTSSRPLQAKLTLEVDCTVTAVDVSCAALPSSNRPLYLSLFSLLGGVPASDGVALKALSGFSEHVFRVRDFQIASDGTVQSWDFEGTEYKQVGDFKLSDQGDAWAYAGWARDPEMTYCEVVYGYAVGYDYRTGLCTNGAPVFPDPLKTQWDLGTGIWTSNLAAVRASVQPVPLPSGIPLVLGGMGLLAFLRRRTLSCRARPQARQGVAFCSSSTCTSCDPHDRLAS